jgi:hypothetical protein
MKEDVKKEFFKVAHYDMIYSDFVYDPFKGVDTEKMTDIEKHMDLSKAGEICAKSAIENIIQRTFEESRKKEIYKFTDSYGANHGLDSSGITVAWFY